LSESIDFDARYHYAETAAGILVPITLIRGDRRVSLKARLDTGAADCVFDSHYAQVLGIDMTSGLPRTYRTVTGGFTAYGHEVSISTLGMEWSATVFFHDSVNPANAFLGRRGWLDRVRLGLVHYEESLYLSPYSR
jgi:hypothetical protein